MTPNQHPAHREQSRKTCVLYDHESGVIRHIQHAIVMEGGYDPTEAEIEAIARRSFEKRNAPHGHLKALHVAAERFDSPKAYRVDPTRIALVEKEAKF
jgi:hypothetical protein